MKLDANCAAAIWNALAALPSLRRVEWELNDEPRPGQVWVEDDDEEPICLDLNPVLQHLTKLTQIR